MGLYDHVTFFMDCPNCKAPLKEFQTKDSSCMMDTIDFIEVDNFYDKCKVCDAFVEFYYNKWKPENVRSIEDYTLEITTYKKQGPGQSWKANVIRVQANHKLLPIY